MGDPFSRDPDAVLWDVRRGLVSVEAAREGYGVVIDGGELDTERTRAARSARRKGSDRPVPSGEFTFGAERDAYEEIWTDPMQLAVSGALSSYPTPQRGYLRVSVMREVERRLRAGERLGPADVDALLRGIAARLSTHGGSAGARTVAAGTAP